MMSQPAGAARRHPGGGLPLDQLPPQVRALRQEPPGSTAAEWQRWNVAFHDSLVAAGDTASVLYAYAVEGLVEGLLSVQEVSTPEARELAWRALALKRNHLGPDHVEIVRTLMNVALVESYGFEADRVADSLLAIAIGIQRRVVGAKPGPLMSVFAQRAGMLMGINDASALAHLDTVIALASAASPPESSRILGAVTLRGEIRANQGYVEEAVDAQRRLLAHAMRVRPDDERGIAIVQHNLGSALMFAGHPGEALVEMSRGRDYMIRHLGATHYEVRTSETWVATTYYLLGDFVSARRHFEAALQRAPGESLARGDLLEPTVGLGVLELDEGHPVRARELIEEGVHGLVARSDRSQAYTAIALESLAACLVTLNRPDSALVVLESAKEIGRRESPGCANCTSPALRMVEATTLLALRDTTRAIAVLESTVVEVEAHPGRRVHFAWQARMELARLAAARGERDRAFDLALAVESEGRTEVIAAIDELPDRWALRLAALRTSGLGLLGDLCGSWPEAAGPRERAVFDEAVRSRALLLDLMAGRRSLAQQRSQTNIAPLWHRWDTARRRLREFEEEPGSTAADTATERTRQSLLRELDVAEADLAARANAERAIASRGDTIGIDAVARSLRPGDALISYLRLRRGEKPLWDDPGRAGVAADSYIAFVLPQGASYPQVFRLGDAAAIDRAVHVWLAASDPSAFASQDSASDDAGHRLRSRIWDPLQSALGGVQRVFVVPDASLGLVDPSGLPDGRGGYLVEGDLHIAMLGCERDLVGVRGPRSDARRPILAVGGVDYRQLGRPPAEMVSAAFVEDVGADRTLTYRGPRSTCDRLGDVEFEFLPATLSEVSDLDRSAARASPRVAIASLRGADASEPRIKALAPRAGALHLATHGFFTPQACAGGVSAATRSRGVATSDEHALVDNPLTRCGLALAGANRRADAGPDEDDGLLTGDEIAALDLSGVEFVVLSACNTGLGDVLDGEGVLGLQRAFKIAGAGPVVMSLWPVEDRIARQWMRHFYEARLSPGATTAEATRRASLAMLKERRRLGLSTRPSSWAPFLSVGVER